MRITSDVIETARWLRQTNDLDTLAELIHDIMKPIFRKYLKKIYIKYSRGLDTENDFVELERVFSNVLEKIFETKPDKVWIDGVDAKAVVRQDDVTYIIDLYFEIDEGLIETNVDIYVE